MIPEYFQVAPGFFYRAKLVQGTMKKHLQISLQVLDNQMVPRAGIEPTTHCLEGSCSIL